MEDGQGRGFLGFREEWALAHRGRKRAGRCGWRSSRASARTFLGQTCPIETAVGGKAGRRTEYGSSIPWRGSVGNRSRSIISTREHQGRYIRNSLRPHKGTFRALALWTKRRAALKMRVTRSCHLRPRRCGANSIFQTAFRSKPKDCSSGLWPAEFEQSQPVNPMWDEKPAS